MFRFLYILLETLGTVFAILSPIVIGHWLLKAAHIPPIHDILQIFEPFVAPFNHFVDSVNPFKLPQIKYDNDVISSTQALTGGLFTVVFLLCLSSGKFLRQMEEKTRLLRDTLDQKRDMQKAQHQKNAELQATANFDQILVYIAFPFKEFPQIGKAFHQFTDYGGKELPGEYNRLLLGFKDIELAMNFTIQMSKTLTGYYEKLRPTEPRPPFYFALDAIWKQDASETAMTTCSQMIGFASDNQALFSDNIRKVLDAKGVVRQYKQHSIGFYTFSDGKSKEIYLLQPTLPDSAQYF